MQPIADIIGLPWTPDPFSELLHRRAVTVDDLLAWLQAKGYDVSTYTHRTHVDGVAMLGERRTKWVDAISSSGELSRYRAMTLLEALEIAVHTVAGDA